MDDDDSIDDFDDGSTEDMGDDATDEETESDQNSVGASEDILSHFKSTNDSLKPKDENGIDSLNDLDLKKMSLDVSFTVYSLSCSLSRNSSAFASMRRLDLEHRS